MNDGVTAKEVEKASQQTTNNKQKLQLLKLQWLQLRIANLHRFRPNRPLFKVLDLLVDATGVDAKRFIKMPGVQG